jgi:nitrous oxidase accessory protein NosD
MGPRRFRRRLTRLLVGGGAVMALLAILLVGSLSNWWREPDDPGEPQLAGSKNEHPAEEKKLPTNGDQPKPPENGKKNSAEPVKPKVKTIPNGLTVAKDGTGQFKTINEALKKVEPGQTIRVLDDAIYEEELHINQAEQYAGVSLEATQAATIKAPGGAKNVVEIVKVANFIFRGFRLRAEGKLSAFVFVANMCPGLIIEKLDIQVPRKFPCVGFLVMELKGDGKSPPANIRDNQVHDAVAGIGVFGCGGFGESYSTPLSCARLRIENNLFADCKFGIDLVGEVKQIQVVGNRVVRAERYGIQLENLLGGASDILIAHNTTLACGWGFRFWDSGVKGNNIHLCHNLFLASTSEQDLFFIDSGGSPNEGKGAGDGKLVRDAKGWTWEGNWRESEHDKSSANGRIPPGPTDKVEPKIEVLSRKLEDKEFLRPAKNLFLQTPGTASADATFPGYIGAVPPKDAPPWNWQWTWDAFMHKTLTVSKDAKDQARFDSINAALDKIKPGWTIRVLDNAVYEENLVFNDPSRHAGVTLDSLHQAIIQSDAALNTIEVKGVPGLTLKGFRLEAANQKSAALMAVFAGSDALDLERVQFVAPPAKFGHPVNSPTGLEILGAKAKQPGTTAVRVRDCLFQNVRMGVVIQGTDASFKLALPPKGVFVCNNSFRDCNQAISVIGPAQDVLIAGNKIVAARFSGIQIQGMMKPTDNILVANNSLFDSRFSVQFWSTAVHGDNVAFQNNLILAPFGPDMVFVNAVGGTNKINGPGDMTSLLKVWHFSHNWREAKKPIGDDDFSKGWIPPNNKPDKDELQDKIDVLSRNPKDKDFLRPANDSALATAGAGKEDPGLPKYVGAVAAKGVKAWNWDETWKAKFERQRIEH